MSPGFAVGTGLKFEQRWEFRNGENDLSSDDCRSNSSVPLKTEEHKSVSDWISLGGEESSYSQKRLRKKQEATGPKQTNKKDRKVRQKGRSRKGTSVERKKGESSSEACTKQSRGMAYNPSVLNELQTFTKSIIQEFEAERLKMVTWMREEVDKMMSCDASSSCVKEGAHGDKSSTPSQSQNHMETAQVQQLKTFEKGIVLALQCNNRHLQNSIEENVKVRQRRRSMVAVEMQKLKPGKKRESKSANSARSVKRKKKSDPDNHVLAPENNVNKGLGTATGSKPSEDRGLPGTNEPIESSDPLACSTMLAPSKLDLRKGAQGYSIGSSAQSFTSDITTDTNNGCQIPENNNERRLELFPLLNGFSYHSNLVASRKKSAALLTTLNPEVPCESYRPSFNNILSRFTQRDVLNPEGRMGSFAQACSNNNDAPSNHGAALDLSMQTRFPPALYQGLEVNFGETNQFSLQNLLRADENASALGHNTNGGVEAMRIPGDSRSLGQLCYQQFARSCAP